MKNNYLKTISKVKNIAIILTLMIGGLFATPLIASNPGLPETTIAAPTANAATSITSTSFVASWNSVPTSLNYKIYVYRKILIGGITQWMIVTDYNGKLIESTNTTVTDLWSGTAYKYLVIARNKSGDSDNSNEIQVTTLCSAPVANDATNVTPTSFTANWSAATGATSYKYYMIDAAENYIHNGLSVAGTSFNATGLTPNTLYRYRVLAVNSTGESEKSNIITLNTKPTPPVATAASSITTTSFNANWGAVAGATGYKLWIISNVNTGYNPAGYFPKSIGNVTTYNVTGLTPGHSYSYYVQVVTSSGESTVSNSINATTKPTTPAAMNASNITSTSFVANWQTVISATGYKLSVWRKSDYQWVPGYNGKIVSGTSEVVSGLSPTTEYQYSLRALAGETESDNSNHITLTTIAAPPSTYTLSLNASPAGAGTLSGGGTFNEGTTVTAHAAPNAGYNFVNWTEGGTQVSTSASYTFNITANRNLVANFSQQVQKTYTVVVTPSHANRGTVTGGGTYNQGSTVTVTATPSMKTYQFENWTENGSIVSTDASYSFTISADRNLVANFGGQQVTNYTVDLAASPSGTGTLTGAGTFASGSSVTVTATPATGYNFVNWTEGGTQVSTSASYTFNITANRNLVANFEQQVQNYTLTTSVAPVGGGTTNIASATYASGTNVTVTATPLAGYTFVNWTEGGTQVSTSASYSFNISANRTLVANFAQQVQNYTLTTSVAPVGGGTTNIASATYASGSSVTVTATPATGYNFVNWTEGGTQVSTSASYSFNITTNQNLVANFELQTFTITLSSNPTSGGVTNFASSSFSYGQNVTINANVNANNKFINWTENGVEVSDQLSYTFIAVEDRSIVANFELLNGINDQKLQEVKMFPNPTSGVVFLTGLANITSIKLVTLNGNIIKEMIAEKNEVSFSVTDVRKGVYLIMIESEKGAISKKLIIQ